MSRTFAGWSVVADELRKLVQPQVIEIDAGQRASLLALAERLPQNGVIIADEVGMGKTRIAAAAARAVIAAGGRVAILVPPGLGYQWRDELKIVSVDAPPILRSLWQYLQAWQGKGDDAEASRQSVWFEQSTLIVSHAFTNWRLGERASPWRWALLPELYARWRKKTGNRFPWSYCDNPKLDDEWVKKAAEGIVDEINGHPGNHPARELIQRLTEETPWPGAVEAGEYGRDARLRPWLARAVGLGLGVFDLVIIDEAHKSRGQESGLNELLNQVILRSSDARCLAMTATPVELDAEQWKQMLDRIRVDEAQKGRATEAISNYKKAVAVVRQCPSNEGARNEFRKSAEDFKKALDSYLLRRDKREDDAVKKFVEATGESCHAYRQECEIRIDTAQLSCEWKQSVCAAEALSFVARQSDQTTAKRLRLTLGSGHGIASILDQLQQDSDKDDRKQMEADEASDIAADHQQGSRSASDKRLERVQWWQGIMVQPFEANDGSALFEHPAILAAVEEIEAVCNRGEKVLVFGRFTRPLRALVQLLNAREMLRRIGRGLPWPQSKLHDNDAEWNAIRCAHRQLDRQGELDKQALDDALAEQYQKIENQRRSIREKLIDRIENGLAGMKGDRHGRVRALFNAFKTIVDASAQDHGNDDHSLAVVARAMHELMGSGLENATPEDFAQAFIDLVAAASDRDESDANGSQQPEEGQGADDRWAEIKARLQDEHNSPEGGYARLMYGETKPATRRLLQLAFNRKHAHPKVLVVQSVVGREGLNLHKACRTVVLLHPEWNPGVVEQQIGRVDRIHSLWAEALDKAIADGKPISELPRIEVRPVVFRGTYDEKNWQVLHERWDDLRAQLHGIVISPRIAEKYPDAREMIDEINKAAPDFSPTGRQ